MLGEHTMTVNFSYRAISNLILDLNGGHFSKWSPKYTCLNIWVSKSLEKMILVSKYTFSQPSITKWQKQIRRFDLWPNGGHFKKWQPEYTCFNIPVSNPRRKTMLLSKHTFSGPRIAKKPIINTQIQYLTIVAVIFSKMSSRMYVFYYLSFKLI